MNTILQGKWLKDSMVKKTIDIDSVKYQSDFFNISYGSDSEFIYGVGVSISSVIINNPNIIFHFHVFVDYLSDDNQVLFKELIEKTKNKLTFYIIDAQEFSTLPLPSLAWNEAIYYRLLIIHYLSKSVDKLLYLDADIICNGSIDYLLDLNFDRDVFLYAVKDKYQKNNIISNVNKEGYFNSGFLYLSTKLFMSNNIPEHVIRLVSENNYTHPDQDALNQLLSNKYRALSELYNYMFSFDKHISSKHPTYTIPSDAIFIHYVGITKPFFKWASYYNEFKFFESARAASPWKKIALLNAKTYKQLSRKKTHLRKNGDYLGCALTYFKYFIKFFINKDVEK